MEFIDFVQTYWIYFAALAVIILLIVVNEINSARSKKYYLTVSETILLSNYDEEGKNALLVDLRSPKEYQEEHLLHAVNIEYSNIEKELGNRDKYGSRRIILYSSSEPRSQQACIQLRELLDSDEVYVLAGGLTAWKDANQPVSKGKK